MTKYLINEEQYKKLLKNKAEDRIVERIVNDINNVKSKLNESKMHNESIFDVIRTYNKKGYLTENVIDKLSKKNIELN